MTLEQCVIETKNQTDKYDLGYITEFYDSLFTPIKTDVKKVLEIGIYQGDSIKLWYDFFPEALVDGVDVNRCAAIENIDRIRTLYGDAYNINFVNSLEKNSYDIVIDDGPHSYESMVFFLTHYLDLVKPGGICVLEDIIHPSWTPNFVQMLSNRTDIELEVKDMRFKQKTQELYSRWQGGLDVLIIKKN